MEARIRVYTALPFGIHPQDSERRDVPKVGREYVDLDDKRAILSEQGGSQLSVEILQKRSGDGSEHPIGKFTVDEGKIETYPDDTLSRLKGGTFLEVEHVRGTSR